METKIWSACLSLLVFVYVLAKALRRRKLNLPPGPKPWPVIGNLHLIGSLPHKSLHELSQKYGPLIHLQFGSCPVVVGSSVEMAKVILKTMDVNFSSRPRTAAGKYTTYNYSDITWSPYGAYLKQARKMCLTELFSTKRLESYEYIRVEEINLMLKNLYKSSGQPVVLKDYLSTVTLSVISRMVLGKKYLDKENENSVVSLDEFKKMLDELIYLNGVINLGDVIPWLSFLDLQGYVKRMKIVSKKLDRFLEHVLDEHQERRRKVEGYVSRDMVDVLLEQAEDPTLEVKMERHNVKALTQDLLAGGTESSAVTVEWAISELLKKPEIFKKATEEIDRVIGQNRWIQEKDMPNLPYIEAIVKETMRLHPVAPLLMPRLVREDCKDLLAGGTESSTVTIIWAISELLKKPEYFKKATDELDRVIGQNRWVKEKDMPNLPYIDAIMKETMRLHPIAPILTPRLAREDCKVAGYDIKKGTQVFVNVWTIGLDPSIWENPTEFNPDRFIKKPIDVRGHDFELLPFGAGRRMCPGYSLGLKVIMSSLANLIHGFNWKLPAPMKPEDLNMEEVFGLSVPRKVPLVAVPEPRLPLEVYNL
ncbi:UNVERIFIED_CONTAM: Trimethyltridecatetraene synthase [Sesamum radiatum]|uniref:Trimethyltridecatetraene synthase n=1 Tax=Sesamum radiatum TaxID=300843 RepID=A0AAW2WIJ9_SESRA